MKRTGAALALLAILDPLHAQSSVTAYGLLDAAVTVSSGGGGAGTVKRVDSGVGPGSRLGFRGTEDLGSGLRAVFDIQMGLASDTGTLTQGGLAWGRQAFVGLASASGWNLTLGRQYSPTFLAMGVGDALSQYYWGNTTITGIGALQGPGSTSGSGCQGATSRVNNSVLGSWTTGGLTARLMVGAGDESRTGSGRLINPSLTYTRGPLAVAAAYGRFRQCASEIGDDSPPDWQTEIALGGSYDLGAAKLFVGYYDFDPSEANKVLAPRSLLDNRAVWIGSRIKVGATGTVIAQLTRQRQQLEGEDARATTVALTYEHGFSTRTRLYVTAARISNSDTGRIGLLAATASQAASAVGASPRAVSMGVTHVF